MKRHIIIALDNDITISVVRIFCEINFQLRQGIKKLLQYTITVLPGFLIPYSRIPADKAIKAVADYMLGIITSQYGAAFALGCNSRHSFRRYLVRFLARLDTWLAAIHPATRELEADLEKPVTEKWEIISREIKIRAFPHWSEYWREYGHTIFCFRQTGLGP